MSSKLERTYANAKLPFMQEVRRAILALTTRGQLAVNCEHVTKEMQRSKVPGRWTSQEVHNALTFLAARRELLRISRGLYAVMED